MPVNPLAGQPAPVASLVNVPRLITAYYADRPDPKIAAQRVTFGTSGHRGSSLNRSLTNGTSWRRRRPSCDYRKSQESMVRFTSASIPTLFSEPACASALEVLAANGVQVRVAAGREYTPTPAISHAILKYNVGRKAGLADGIVVTPSHNPPPDGGFKYNPPHGGPADSHITGFVQSRANELLEAGLAESSAAGVKRILFERAITASTTSEHDFIAEYVGGLANVLDLDAIRGSTLHLGVDPLGGAGVHYWGPIADRYKLNLKVVNDVVDPTFRFMTLDWDGKIRMDPSSPYAMQSLIHLKDKFSVAFACDTDHDRHGVVTPSAGLLPPNPYLAVCVHYLFQNRPDWSKDAAIGKTVVSSSMIDRVAKGLGRRLHETPVGFKFFVEGLLDGSLVLGEKKAPAHRFCRATGRRGAPIRTASSPHCFPPKSPRVSGKTRDRYMMTYAINTGGRSMNESTRTQLLRREPFCSNCRPKIFPFPS